MFITIYAYCAIFKKWLCIFSRRSYQKLMLFEVQNNSENIMVRILNSGHSQIGSSAASSIKWSVEEIIRKKKFGPRLLARKKIRTMLINVKFFIISIFFLKSLIPSCVASRDKLKDWSFFFLQKWFVELHICIVRILFLFFFAKMICRTTYCNNDLWESYSFSSGRVSSILFFAH
jgi:hypothetical protein